jgi:hypothetical protein
MLRLIFGDAETQQIYRSLRWSFLLAVLFVVSLVQSCGVLWLIHAWRPVFQDCLA